MNGQPPRPGPHDRRSGRDPQADAQIESDVRRLGVQALGVLGSCVLVAFAFFASCSPSDTPTSSSLDWASTWRHDPAGAAAEIDYLEQEAIKYAPNKDDFVPDDGTQETPCTGAPGPGVRVSGSSRIPPSRYPTADTGGIGLATRPAPDRSSYPREVPGPMDVLITSAGFRVTEDDRPAGRPRVTYIRGDGFTAEIDATSGVLEYGFTSSCVPTHP